MRFYCKALLLFVGIATVSFTNSVAQDFEAAPGPGTVTVYSEDGQEFTLYINGDRKNASASARVVANVTEVPIAIRIVFANGTTPELTKKGMRQGTHCLLEVAKNKKGEYALKFMGCNNEPGATTTDAAPSTDEPATATATSSATSQPASLSATYTNGVITLNDGRTFTVKRVKSGGMTYPRVHVTALTGATISIAFDDGKEKYSAESPMQYEVKDFSNNNAYFTLTVDEGGPDKTWKVKLQNSNGYDLKIE